MIDDDESVKAGLNLCPPLSSTTKVPVGFALANEFMFSLSLSRPAALSFILHFKAYYMRVIYV